jgi:hypothetical protein
MLWFLRGLRRGIVTTRYPAGALDDWTRTLPSPPAFRPAALTGELADRLAAACPSGALRHERDLLVVDLGACTGCGHCIKVGGDAVTDSGEFLLAARRREDLIKRVPIAPHRSTGTGSSG